MIRSLYRKLIRHKWLIGISYNTIDEIIIKRNMSFEWLAITDNNRWFADPFILDVTDAEIVLLCEEFSDELKKGRIAKIVVDINTFKLKEWKVVLELPTHLSFPAIIRKEGRIYFYPENFESKHLYIYEYNYNEDSVNKIECLLDSCATDAIITDVFGETRLFCTEHPNENGKALQYYMWSDNEKRFVRKDDIVFNENIARNAGDFLLVDGKIVRPAQDNNETYGRAIVFQQWEQKMGKWKITEISRLNSPHPFFKWGCHTFNHYKGVTVIDVKGPRYPLIGDMLFVLRRLIMKLSAI